MWNNFTRQANNTYRFPFMYIASREINSIRQWICIIYQSLFRPESLISVAFRRRICISLAKRSSVIGLIHLRSPPSQICDSFSPKGPDTSLHTSTALTKKLMWFSCLFWSIQLLTGTHNTFREFCLVVKQLAFVTLNVLLDFKMLKQVYT